MELKDLVGFQLVELNDDTMVVKKDNNVYTIDFNRDEGDCCGYTEVENNLLFDKNNTKSNPIITKIETESDTDEYGDYDVINITLFGEYKPMATIRAEAGSGSGWCYGASVTVECKPLQLEETIVSW